jgi:prophage regulatory protein
MSRQKLSKTTAPNAQQTRILRTPEVMLRTGLPLSTLYWQSKQGYFPKQVQIGPNAVGWVESEVEDWIRQQIADRDAGISRKDKGGRPRKIRAVAETPVSQAAESHHAANKRTGEARRHRSEVTAGA